MEHDTIIAIADCISRLRLDYELKSIELEEAKHRITQLEKENEALKIELKEATTND